MKELLVKLLNNIQFKLAVYPEYEIFLCIEAFSLKKSESEKVREYLQQNKPSPTLHKEHYVKPNEKFYGRDMWFEYADNESRINFLKYLIELETKSLSK
jgi:hypothetical protein